MFSINLLSNREKENIRYEMYSRFLFVIGTAFLGSFVTFGVLLTPSLLFLIFERGDLAREVDIALQGQKVANVEQTVKEISDTNKRLALLTGLKAGTHQAGHVFDMFASYTSSGTTFDEFLYSAETQEVHIKGHAQRRQDFIDFKQKVERDVAVASIISPIANVIKETNVEFVLTITLK